MLMPDLKEITDEMKPQTIISKYIWQFKNIFLIYYFSIDILFLLKYVFILKKSNIPL